MGSAHACWIAILISMANKTIQFPCSVCREDVPYPKRINDYNNQSVQCKECSLWVHIQCIVKSPSNNPPANFHNGVFKTVHAKGYKFICVPCQSKSTVSQSKPSPAPRRRSLPLKMVLHAECQTDAPAIDDQSECDKCSVKPTSPNDSQIPRPSPAKCHSGSQTEQANPHSFAQVAQSQPPQRPVEPSSKALEKDSVPFRGQEHILSNMSGCESFLLDNASPPNRYPDAEMYYQCWKADFHNRPDIRHEMMYCSKNAYDVKRISKKIVTSNEWEEVKFDVMYRVLLAKCRASPKFVKFLIDSKGKILLHTTRYPNSDLIWTCGLDNDLNLEFGAFLPGLNQLGQLLMKLRDEILSDPSRFLPNISDARPLFSTQNAKVNVVNNVTEQTTSLRKTRCGVCAGGNHSDS